MKPASQEQDWRRHLPLIGIGPAWMQRAGARRKAAKAARRAEFRAAVAARREQSEESLGQLLLWAAAVLAFAGLALLALFS